MEDIVTNSDSSLELRKAAIALIQSKINSYNIQRMGVWERNHCADMSEFDVKISELRKKKEELQQTLQSQRFSGLALELDTPNGKEYISLG